jgi:hypothetical protein
VEPVEPRPHGGAPASVSVSAVQGEKLFPAGGAALNYAVQCSAV